MSIPKNKQKFGFLRAGAVCPEVVIGDIPQTTKNILSLAHDAVVANGCRLIVFPELCLAGGYTNADLFHQTLVQEKALEGLERIMKESVRIHATIIVGLPLAVNGNLYNVAAVISGGKIDGIVPKTYLPTGGEFYEGRWFGSAHDLTVKHTQIFGQSVPIGTDLLFVSVDDPTIVIGVETCEDVWTALPPSSFAAVAGANVLVNLSASNELVGKDEYRRNLITQQSGRCIAAYIYSSAGDGESTTDVVFGGHCMIAENGTLLAESKRFQEMGHSIFVDLDIENCIHERMRTTSFGKCAAELKHREPYRRIFVSNLVTHTPKIEEFQTLLRPNTSHPFVPAKDADRDGVCKEVFDIVVAGLAHRLKKTRSKTVVLGLSGGLDSTLALLTCCKAFDRLGYDHANIRAFTMPGFGTSKRTRLNAMRLAAATFITLEEISVEEGSKVVLENIGHDGTTEDVTFENAQARYRTLILMQKANQLKGIVVGTGDLSESALGWCTYNGDQMSHYNVNCGIPKTLVRFVVDWVSKLGPDDLEKVLQNILTTPVSPELKKLQAGKITQKTEDHIGPYDLHDFFLYHLQRRGAAPRKILYLAVHAFKGAFTKEEIKKWLVLFITRFFQNQFKRSAMPDGPKVGSVSLSQRGDWRMPSDATAKQWLADLEDE